MKPQRQPTRLNEVELFQGLGHGDLVDWHRQQARPCACSGVVLADPDNPAAGVAEHRETPRHRAWRERWPAE